MITASTIHTSHTSLGNIFNPVGMIPEFNALGNHPNNVFEYLDNVVEPKLRDLGVSKSTIGDILHYGRMVIRQFQRRPQEFVGHHQPTPEQLHLSLLFLQALIKPNQCLLYGARNYNIAQDLARYGDNVVMVHNHTSVLDSFVWYGALARHFSTYLPMTFMMSNVFEYVPITALMTAGADKFRVFQPKHIERARHNGIEGKRTAVEMQRQNAASLLSLNNYCRDGRRIIAFYPERNRSVTMGAPEPKYLTMLRAMQPKGNGRQLYVMPANTTGRYPVIPNQPGPNELDTIFERAQIGHGAMYCGAPVPLAHIERVVDEADQNRLGREILGEIPGGCSLRDTSLGLALLSMVASLSPDDRGIYDNPASISLARRCFEE